MIGRVTLMLLCTVATGTYGETAQTSIAAPAWTAVIQDVIPGETQTALNSEGRGILVFNRSESPVTLRWSVERPLRTRCPRRYEPVPDPSWVQPQPRDLSIPARDDAEERIDLTVPKDRKWAGRRYCADLVAVSTGESEDSPLQISGSLRFRLQFSVKR